MGVVYNAEDTRLHRSRVQVSDGKLGQLVSLKNIRRSGSYLWTGLAPDGSPLLLRDVATEEIYALDLNAP
jgi:hypothetical protein